MIRRARLLGVLVILLAGAVGLIGSTQTWFEVVLADGAAEPLAVPGASAVAVLAPLSLAALALGGALTIAGRVLRYVFAGLGLLIALGLGWSVITALSAPLGAVTGAVTEATGIAGADAIHDLVDTVTPTAWPVVTVIGAVLLAAASVFVLVTAGRWGGSADRRYRSAGGAGRPAESRPHDAIDSWDDLSRGADPTA